MRKPPFSKYRRRREGTTKNLLAGAAVVEASGTLDNLLLSDGDDVDGDGVELREIISIYRGSYVVNMNLRPSS